jgi:putative nucleotidyltransferase with HDIG domain
LKNLLTHPIIPIITEVAQERKVAVYVIGGYVRDLLLNRKSKDIDFLIIGNGIEFAEAVALKIGNKTAVNVFKNFGTAMLNYKGWEIEFVGARKESYRNDSRKPIVEDGNLQDDQNRRDFTINTLAISLAKINYGKLIDPFDGMKDIEQKLIRTPLEPNVTYSDDPLRMMRAIRFAAQLNFKIDAASLQAITENKERIQIVSKERITDELNKIMLSAKPSIGFEHLFNTGLLQIIFPEVANLHGVETINGKAHKDNFYHTLQVLDNICEHTDDLWLRWAALLHDIAKPATKRFEPEHGWTFHGHEDKGARMVPKIFKELRLPQNEKMKLVQKLVLLHLRPIVLAQNTVTDSAVRRLLFEAGEDIDALMILCNADITTKNEYKVKKYKNNFELVKEKIVEVEAKDQLRNWQPPIDGNDIMQAFGLAAGKEVGLLKNTIREAILEGVIPNEKTAAIELMMAEGKKLGLIAK